MPEDVLQNSETEGVPLWALASRQRCGREESSAMAEVADNEMKSTGVADAHDAFEGSDFSKHLRAGMDPEHPYQTSLQRARGACSASSCGLPTPPGPTRTTRATVAEAHWRSSALPSYPIGHFDRMLVAASNRTQLSNFTASSQFVHTFRRQLPPCRESPCTRPAQFRPGYTTKLRILRNIRLVGNLELWLRWPINSLSWRVFSHVSPSAAEEQGQPEAEQE